MVGEPSVEDTISILRGLKESTKFIMASRSRTQPRDRGHRAFESIYHGPVFPDKAIDLIDEAAARLQDGDRQHADRTR